ncbi:deoxyribonuclease-2-alpha-like [Polypterus senegalus]|uniref:deoxyribonuclease-2-alpha-like n=1 Tax=Polypterus senegalus TaxID=55291 RepID=UPI0019666F8A|nr:deoxyribonuclease-2-alpha-like [Polypterus senegalus]
MEGFHGRLCFVWMALCFGPAACAKVTCRSENGASVDWFILYKLPKMNKSSGLNYLYMDASTNGWLNGKFNINDTQSAVGQTLEPYFTYIERKTEGFGFLLYNDQPPTKSKSLPSSSFGHSKGMILLDKTTGIWLTHSTPQFPGGSRAAFWPKNGVDFGQTFLCVTYPYNLFKDIAIQLQYIHPFTFNYDLPKTFPLELRCVAQRECYPKTAPWSRQLKMMSAGGNTFVSFVKYLQFKDDLYSGLLVEPLGDDLFAKGWGRLHSPLPSNCSMKHNVYNIITVNLPKVTPFKTTFDHSKWCVTKGASGRDPWTCIADLNREKGQMLRGGGAVCTSDPVVWKTFRKMVGEFEKCP